MSMDFSKELPEEKWFHIVAGSTVKSLLDLFEAIPRMNEFQFEHHVHNGKSDLAKWVFDVYGDSSLAKEIGEAKTREKLFGILGHMLGECSGEEITSKTTDLASVRVKPENCFLIHNGPAICNLPAFKRFLPKMTDAQFYFHVNGSKK